MKAVSLRLEKKILTRKRKVVVVRFARQDLRDAWLEKRKALRELKESTYIAENMTKRSKMLLVTIKA